MTGWWAVGTIIGLAIAAGTFFMGRSTQRRRGQLLGVETLSTGTIKDLCAAASGAAGAGAFRHPVEVAGTAEAGPTGLLTSELSHAECVWHRHKVTRRYRHQETDSQGKRTTSTREEVVAELTTEDAFELRDAAGTITVIPTRVVDGATKSLSEFREPTTHDEGATVRVGPLEIDLGGGDNTLGFEYEEWILKPGTTVFVHGEATDASGALAIAEPAGKSKLVISTKSETQLLDAAEKEAKGLRVATLVGLGIAVACLVLSFIF